MSRNEIFGRSPTFLFRIVDAKLYLREDGVKSAMDENAIEFAKWVSMEYVMVNYLTKEFKWCVPDVAKYGGNEKDYYTIEQLYKLYLSVN